MRELTVELDSRSYPIFIGRGLLAAPAAWQRLSLSSQQLVVTNETIAPLYLDRLPAAPPGVSRASLVIPDGESYKTLATLNLIITRLLELRYSRDCCLIALGGGVVGDVTGFAAACYQRGVGYVQVPTTLLAQVDSAVGGKTAVNHELGKNMIGAFYQPAAVIADTTVMDTLPDRELSAGLAEVIKYGLIRDAQFFVWLEENMDRLTGRDPVALAHAVEQSCRNKAEVVALDEREGGIRAILNLGHTFGHAIETSMNYRGWLHGEAVAAGIVMAADLSRHKGWLEDTVVTRIRNLLQRAGLPLALPPTIRGTDLRANMSIDKKARGGRLYLVLLQGIGKAVVTADFEESLLQRTLADFPSAAA